MPKAMEHADIRARAGRLGRRGRCGRARPASTSSTSTARTPTCPRSSSRRVYNRRTDEYGGSFENRARFWLEAIERVQRGGRRRHRDRRADRRRHARRLSGVPTRGGARVHPRAPTAGRPLGRASIGVDVRAPGRLDAGASRFFDQGYQLEWSGRAREATDKPIVVVGRFTDPDLMADARARRRRRPDRRRAAVDRRPVPAGQDRAGPLRRDPRVHRLQRLLLAVDLGPPPGLHAERDGGRGAPPRLAPGAVRAAPRTPTAACSSSAPGRPGWSARSVLGKRGMELVHLVDADDDIGGCMRWITRMPGPRRRGATWSTTGACSSTGSTTSRSASASRADGGRACWTTAPRS